MIYTIKTDDPSQSTRLNQFLKELVGIQYSVINDAPKNPASVLSIEEFQARIKKSRESVKKGLFLTDEEIENESSKW
ncbi:MAG: hypothetical protein GZ094_15080 [Mariniphaga sp.]|nr:hypothetical protein [Mariniphaga sp.]